MLIRVRKAQIQTVDWKYALKDEKERGLTESESAPALKGSTIDDVVDRSIEKESDHLFLFKCQVASALWQVITHGSQKTKQAAP